MIIAIDGPSASGKGTVAKKIATYFKLPYLNTGALYRLVAFRVLYQKIDVENFYKYLDLLTQNITESDLENEELFSENVGATASIIAKNPLLRKELLVLQKKFITKSRQDFNGAVLDGRDTTTIVCVDADYKFFITASVETRAKRRFMQLQKKGEKVFYDEILTQLKLRDENDKTRKDSPLLIAKDAIIIDNSDIDAEQTFMKVLSYIKN